MKKYQSFLSENFQFLEVKFSIYLNRLVFVMTCPFYSQALTCHVNCLIRRQFAPTYQSLFSGINTKT